MGNDTWNYLLDVLMGLLVLVLGTSTLLLWIVLPEGEGSARLVWSGLQRWTGVALGVLVTLHLILRRKWLVEMTTRALDWLSERDSGSFEQPCDDPDEMCRVDRERRQFW